jgi:hypothetical protein
MTLTMSLFEGMILLAIAGVFTVAWWGVKRIVKTNDDEAKVLQDINVNLKKVCERLSASDIWMEMHTRLDDERHTENKKVLEKLRESVYDLKTAIGGLRNE